jgi:hypothetical protein
LDDDIPLADTTPAKKSPAKKKTSAKDFLVQDLIDGVDDIVNNQEETP